MEALAIRKLTRLIKRLLWLLLILLVAADTKANHVVIAQWNFNSNPPDAQTRTGAIIPSFGVGTAALVGGQTFEFYEVNSAPVLPAAEHSDVGRADSAHGDEQGERCGHPGQRADVSVGKRAD